MVDRAEICSPWAHSFHEPHHPHSVLRSVTAWRRRSSASFVLRQGAQGLEERKQNLLISSVGGGKSSLAAGASRPLMELKPIYVLKGGNSYLSPIFSEPVVPVRPGNHGREVSRERVLHIPIRRLSPDAPCGSTGRGHHQIPRCGDLLFAAAPDRHLQNLSRPRKQSGRVLPRRKGGTFTLLLAQNHPDAYVLRRFGTVQTQGVL